MTCSDRRRDLGLLLLRLGVGGTLAAHGSQKLFGWFGGGGIEGTAQFMDSVGFEPGKLSAMAAGIGEGGGGTLLALGLATPAAGALAAGAMAGATAVTWPNGFFAQKGGFELSGVLGAATVALAISGPGRYSFDHVFRNVFNRPWMVPVALAVAGAGTAVVVSRRDKHVQKLKEQKTARATVAAAKTG
ncbi:DoxX family membrane protein [Streptomyces sp. NBC_00820]|uniref:DoxX family protein n=1 Tax=Streptomyces sp. NBC_00820 TaxID=2975842 RepID=UPI002ED290C6|nr:DoxX family membrane protein [Streptomyces sp. NBC_00820]